MPALMPALADADIPIRGETGSTIRIPAPGVGVEQSSNGENNESIG